MEQSQFSEIMLLIRQSRMSAYQAVNKALIELYWNIGSYISKKTDIEGWG